MGTKPFENIEGKGENAGNQQFLLSHNVFKRLLSQSRQKLGLCGKELTLTNNNVLDWSNLKAIADDEVNVTQNLKFVWEG